MMKHTRGLLLGLAAGMLLLPGTAGAHDDSHGEMTVSKQKRGQSAALGNGEVSVYAVLDNENEGARRGGRALVEMGVEIPSKVMNSLPQDNVALVLNFPAQAKNTPIQYMMLDWNPHGHEPAGVYDRPHFDFHFYMQDLEDVMAIDPGPCSGLACDDYARAVKPVPAQFLPEGYINVNSVVPYMGNHLVDPTSPEFSGIPFTRTWLYGAYDGHITFYEPMITRAALMQEPNQCANLKLPRQYEESGYYPTKYCTEFDKAADVYRISIKGFVYRTAPGAEFPGRRHH